MDAVEQVKLARKYLKMKVMEDSVTFRGHQVQSSHLQGLLARTVDCGESNSALIVGPRGCGKTTLVNNVLLKLCKNQNFRENSILIKLNGRIHTDDKIALKSITTQMNLSNAVGDRIFGSFSENLQFLLSCLKLGKDKHCKSVIFILDEFDMFCHSTGNQTLLYNLFDISQSKQAPVCVIGVTCRLDVMELLEKRVKSRFSHRQIFIFPGVNQSSEDNEDRGFKNRLQLFTNLLSLPSDIKANDFDVEIRESKNMNSDDEILNDTSQFAIPHDVLVKCKCSWTSFIDLDPIFVSFWNENIKCLVKDSNVINCLQRMYDLDISEQTFKNFLTELICKISNDHPQIDVNDVIEVCKKFYADDRVLVLTSLSILEISLVIEMKHQRDILDEQPMNFEMIFNRYVKFASCNSSSQIVPRAVILKAFEHLRFLELIAPLKDSALSNSYAQKEYQFYKLLITDSQISEAIKLYKALPTELAQWASSSIL